MSTEIFRRTTRAIEVAVRPIYLEDQSEPDQRQFTWAYQVRIENRGTETVQLRMRHWRITDGNGHVDAVDGPGVVGEEPVLRPGEHHEYTSGATLTTPSGLMGGTYDMETPSGERFPVEIPTFSLDSPHQRPN